MSTALSLQTTGLQKIERPGHEIVPVQIHAALPRPPKVCDTLNHAVPTGFTGVDRMKHLAAQSDEILTFPVHVTLA